MRNLLWFLLGVIGGFVAAHLMNKDPRGHEVLADVDARIARVHRPHRRCVPRTGGALLRRRRRREGCRQRRVRRGQEHAADVTDTAKSTVTEIADTAHSTAPDTVDAAECGAEARAGRGIRSRATHAERSRSTPTDSDARHATDSRRPRRRLTDRRCPAEESLRRMKTAEIAQRFLDYFEKNGHTHRAVRVARHRRPGTAVHGGGHGAVHPVSERRRSRALSPCGRHPEVHPHQRHRRGRQDAPARHVLPDARQLVVRRLLQGGRDHASRGSC